MRHTHAVIWRTYAQPEIDQQLIPEVASWCGCRNWHDAILNFQYLVYSIWIQCQVSHWEGFNVKMLDMDVSTTFVTDFLSESASSTLAKVIMSSLATLPAITASYTNDEQVAIFTANGKSLLGLLVSLVSFAFWIFLSLFWVSWFHLHDLATHST